MILILQCFWYLLEHKKYVWIFGRILNVPMWSLFIHDWTKLMRAELEGYVHYYEYKETRNQKFYEALHHHFLWNEHHWNHWVTMLDDGDLTKEYSAICIPMPDARIREMVADWAAAGYVKRGYLDLEGYYETIKDVILLHAETRIKVERYIEILVHDKRTKHLRRKI